MRKQLLSLVGGIFVGGIFVSMLWSTSSIGVRKDSVIDKLARLIPQSSVMTASVSSEPYESFENVYSILKENYYTTGEIDSGAMRMQAIKAYVEGLGDYPYTIYMDAKETSGTVQSLKGSEDFEGIGAIIAKVTEGVIIEQIIKDSPSYKNGLLPLDLIVQIGQTGTRDLTLFEAVQFIRGPKGTPVDLTLVRTNKNNKKELLKKTITRELLSVPSVRGELKTGLNNKRLGYIAISSIGEETEKMMKQTIRELSGKQLQGVILDLRGNGGGFLPIAVQIASHFVPKGILIVSSQFKAIQGEKYYSAGYGPFENIPVVVLIDGLTASAGEIIALALQQNRNALLIGSTTFGKGSIQTIHDLDNGNSLKVTIGRRYAPDNTNVNHVGIKPDREVALDREEYIKTGRDPQLESAIKELSNRIK